MTERVVPYWVGNVARINFPSKAFYTSPDPILYGHGQSAAPPLSAKIIKFDPQPKKMLK